MSSPQAEAIEILSSVLSDLFKGSSEIKGLLRRCVHVCHILEWSEQLTWFQHELNGYPHGVELPWYRKSVGGSTKWHVTGGIYTIIESVVENEHSNKKELPKYTEMDVRAGIDWILSAAQSGYVESTGRKSSKYISFCQKHVETEEANVYDKHVFQTIITNIENIAFNFASNSYAVLRYGDALQDVWQAYRAKVEEHLAPIGFAKHLYETS